MYDDLQLSHHVLDTMEVMAEDGVRLWECNYDRNKRRHRRRYGFAPQPLFLYGLGPWNINPGAKYSIQVKRAVSVVTIRRQPVEAELRLPVTKRQLVATISCETLHHDKAKVNTQLTCGYVAVLEEISVKREFDRGPRRPVVFFWTPDYWYRPRSAKDAYQELQTHLTKINQYHQKTKRNCLSRSLFWVGPIARVGSQVGGACSGAGPRPEWNLPNRSRTAPTSAPSTASRRSASRWCGSTCSGGRAATCATWVGRSRNTKY
jgi:hypothetical protein